MKKLFIIFLLSLWATPLLAATYYVDYSAGTGGDGDCATAFDSILDVADGNGNGVTLAAGDIVLVRNDINGTQASTATYTSDGSDADINDITFGTYTWSAGPTCTPDAIGASITRPVIDMTGTGSVIQVSGSYYHIYNLHLTDGEDYVIHAKPTTGDESNLIVEYCTLEGVTGDIAAGVFAGGGPTTGGFYTYNFGSVTVRYCDIDVNDLADESGLDGDGVEFLYNSDEGTITGNIIYDYDHFGIRTAGENTTVTENFIKDRLGHGDGCIALGTTAATGGDDVGWNWCDNGAGTGLGVQVLGKQNNIIHHNVIMDTDYHAQQGSIQITNYTTYSASGNKVLNNVIFNTDTDMPAIRVHADNSTIDNIDIVNNIILDGGLTYAAIRVIDDGAYIDISTYDIHNNNVYGFGGDYAEIEGATKSTAQLNAEAYASGNVDEDPQLNDKDNDEFWPSGISSNSYQAGYNTGTDYDDYLLESSDFTATPPSVVTQQEDSHHIGAYGVLSPTSTITGVSIQ